VESAVLYAKVSDKKNADRLFARALEAQKSVNAMNWWNALAMIAKDQARVGYIDDALKTAALIKQTDSEHEQTMYAIAIAQIKSNDIDGAVRTAMSIKFYVQYRDDSLEQIAEHQIAKGDLKSALTTAEKFDNPSKKATAILKVATAHAKLGNRKTAANVAGQIDLTYTDDLLKALHKEHFNFRQPHSWSGGYDGSTASTGASRHWADMRAAEVAESAMTLAQAFGQQPDKPYDLLFNDCNAEEVIQAIARAHAASGDANKALTWAKRIGSSDKIKAKNDSKTMWAVERRIHALIGVAEGILDRSSETP
jgi:tetratricopeptide (TPR) repeat protein